MESFTDSAWCRRCHASWVLQQDYLQEAEDEARPTVSVSVLWSSRWSVGSGIDGPKTHPLGLVDRLDPGRDLEDVESVAF